MPVAGGGFEQCYNARAAVAAGSMLVAAVDVVQAHNDKQQIERTHSASAPVRSPMTRKSDVAAITGSLRIVRRAAGLHADLAGRDSREERQKIRTLVLACRRRGAIGRQRVDLKIVLARIDPNSRIFLHGRSPLLWRSGDQFLGTLMPLGEAVHTIIASAGNNPGVAGET